MISPLLTYLLTLWKYVYSLLLLFIGHCIISILEEQFLTAISILILFTYYYIIIVHSILYYFLRTYSTFLKFIRRHNISVNTPPASILIDFILIDISLEFSLHFDFFISGLIRCTGPAARRTSSSADHRFWSSRRYIALHHWHAALLLTHFIRSIAALILRHINISSSGKLRPSTFPLL
jgi:hypothetical protein